VSKEKVSKFINEWIVGIQLEDPRLEKKIRKYLDDEILPKIVIPEDAIHNQSTKRPFFNRLKKQVDKLISDYSRIQDDANSKDIPNSNLNYDYVVSNYHIVEFLNRYKWKMYIIWGMPEPGIIKALRNLNNTSLGRSLDQENDSLKTLKEVNKTIVTSEVSETTLQINKTDLCRFIHLIYESNIEEGKSKRKIATDLGIFKYFNSKGYKHKLSKIHKQSQIDKLELLINEKYQNLSTARKLNSLLIGYNNF